MKYYYLISSLLLLDPDDSSLSQDQLKEIIQLIHRNLTPKDWEILKCLLQINDNRNLISILAKEYHDFSIRSFNGPVSIPVETLKSYRSEYASLPPYMLSYLKDLSGSFISMTMRDMEQTLDQYFYEYVKGLDNLFLNTYFRWTHTLHQTVADSNKKTFSFLQTEDDADEPFFPTVKTLPGLTDMAEIASQMQPLMESKNLEAIEGKMNKYYWEFANCWEEPFSAQQVFAYMVKLMRIHRWKRVKSKEDTAKTSFETLVAEIKQNKPSVKMSLI